MRCRLPAGIPPPCQADVVEATYDRAMKGRLWLGILLVAGLLTGCPGGGESRARPKTGEQRVVATFKDDFMPRGVAVDGAGTVYTSGWDGTRFVIAAFPEKGKPFRFPIPCTTEVGADKPLFFSLVAADDGTLFWAYDNQNRVVRIEPGGRTGGCYAGTGVAGNSGDGGPAAQAQLDDPSFLALDNQTMDLFIADPQGGPVRKVDAAGMITSPFEGVAQGRLGGRPGGSLAFGKRDGTLYADEARATGILALARNGSGRLIPGTGSGFRFENMVADPAREGLLLVRAEPECDVARLSLEGQVTPVVGADLRPDCAHAIAVDPQGDIWVVNDYQLIVIGAERS